MNDKQEINYKDTLHLPQTDFPMKGDGPRREPSIQQFWEDNKIYEKALEKRKKTNAERFLLHDGPPYLSSGNIHIGTALNKILKDIVVKYKTLSGYYSPYLPGFDCHGLPIESAVLKANKEHKDQKDQKEQKKLAPLELRKKCIEFVLQNRKSQEEKFKRLGVLGDWGNSYMTIHPRFEARQLELFGQMVDKGYIYRGLKPVYWCTSCQTALAEAEVEYVENYKSPSIYVSFKVTKLSEKASKLQKCNDLKVVIWTTTPWTIPGNLAVCLNESFEYVVVKSIKFGHLLLAKDLLESFNKKISEDCEILETIEGKELEGTICKHPLYDRESPIILGEHVTLETGTGCVHTAPGHGLEDFHISHKYGLGVLSPVDSKGLLTEEAGPDLTGLQVHKTGNQKVTELLLNSGALIFQEDYLHSYPHCWRSKTPIIFRATEQWFCSIKPFKDKALAEIEKVKWIPDAGKNRIYSMVESRSDWCISRQRVWGVPIPAFYCNSCKKVHLSKKIVDNVAKIMEEKGSNVWWELNEDSLLLPGYKCDCGSMSFIKETDIMDVWFDSGSTHYSVVDQIPSLHDKDKKGSPSEIYLEGSDQHRGWFQSSLLTSVAINDKAPYKMVLTHGFVLDESGRKMSKSIGNVVEPEKVINEYGADILRLWVSSVDYSSDMRIGQNMLKQLAEVYRNIRNTARFILGNLCDFNDSIRENYPLEKLWLIDKYILLYIEKEIKPEIDSYFNNYDFYRYYQKLQNFCAVDLSSFYFDIVKDRLYTGTLEQRQAVQFVLREILDTLIPVLCPVLPHLAEDIWTHLPENLNKHVESALCLDWPKQNLRFMTEFGPAENYIRDGILKVRTIVNKTLEIARAAKKIGKSLEAKVLICFPNSSDNYNVLSDLNKHNPKELEALFIVSQVEICNILPADLSSDYYSRVDDEGCTVIVTSANGMKCIRCWKYSTDIGKHSTHKEICSSCIKAVDEHLQPNVV